MLIAFVCREQQISGNLVKKEAQLIDCYKVSLGLMVRVSDSSPRGPGFDTLESQTNSVLYIRWMSWLFHPWHVWRKSSKFWAFSSYTRNNHESLQFLSFFELFRVLLVKTQIDSKIIDKTRIFEFRFKLELEIDFDFEFDVETRTRLGPKFWVEILHWLNLDLVRIKYPLRSGDEYGFGVSCAPHKINTFLWVLLCQRKGGGGRRNGRVISRIQMHMFVVEAERRQVQTRSAARHAPPPP